MMIPFLIIFQIFIFNIGNCQQLSNGVDFFVTPDPSNDPNRVRSRQSIGTNSSFSTYQNIGEGRPVDKYEFPWLVRIEVFFKNRIDTRFCSASLISEEWLLTAASCVTPNAALVMAYFGRHDISQANELNMFNLPAIDIKIHPNFEYGDINYNYDLALVRLNTKVLDSSVAKHIDLADERQCNQNDRFGIDSCSIATVVGWNSTIFSSPRKTNRALTTFAECENSWNTYRGLLLSPAKLCAGGRDEPVDPCVGDQGGPVICAESGYTYQLAVVSHGSLSCRSGTTRFPAIYTRTCAGLPWIREYVPLRVPVITTPVPTSTESAAGFNARHFANIYGRDRLNDDCGAVPLIANGYIDSRGGSSVGSSRLVICLPDFVLVGANVVVCYGTWSEPGICTRQSNTVTFEPVYERKCSVPHIQSGYFYDPRNFGRLPNTSLVSVGIQIRLVCETGYYVSGNEDVTCIAMETWDRRVGTCVSQVHYTPCREPPSIRNGYVDSGGYQYNSVRIIRCNSGYNITGPGTITCLQSGAWSTHGECVQPLSTFRTNTGGCGEPPLIANGYITQNSSQRLSVATAGATRGVACNSGFFVDGAFYIVCQSNGYWTNPGVCKPLFTFGEPLTATWPQIRTTTTPSPALIIQQQFQFSDAAASGNITSLQQLLSLGYLNVNWNDARSRQDCSWQLSNMTALHRAAACNRSQDIINLLVNNGADVNVGESVHGKQPLFISAGNGNNNLVYILLNNGAMINARDNYGSTALIYAATSGHSDTVDLLLDRGCFIDAQASPNGQTALMTASSNGHTNVVAKLLARGANVNLRDSQGRTALMLASGNGHTGCVRLLIEYGADIPGCSSGLCRLN